MFDPDRSTTMLDDRNQIEAIGPLLGLTQPEKGAGRVLDPAPLLGPNRVSGIGRFVAGSRFDFNEDEELSLGADQVDLARNAPVVPREDAVSLPLEKAGRAPFASDAQTKVLTRPPQPSNASL